jgi:hypothetical protein
MLQTKGGGRGALFQGKVSGIGARRAALTAALEAGVAQPSA